MTGYLTCCFYFNRQSASAGAGAGTGDGQSDAKFAIKSVDKSMIGFPTNFQHCQHIGCSDVSLLSSNSSSNSNNQNKNQNQNNNNNNNNQNNNNVNANNGSYRHQQDQNQNHLVRHMKLIDLKT